MIREEYLRRLVDAAHVDLYLSANDGARIYWPWRMHPPGEATESYRNACERYAIDSDPKDDDVTAREVLDTAHRLDAEVASLQDVYQDKDATVSSLRDGLSVAESHPFDGALLLPLQAPFVECWDDLDRPTDCWLGIGGLKEASDRRRITATKRLRDAVGDGVNIHGFGWGPRGDLAAAIRREPALLDSIDYSTPMQTTPDTPPTPGEERMSVHAAYAGYQLIRDLRDVTPYPDDHPAVAPQAGVTDF